MTPKTYVPMEVLDGGGRISFSVSSTQSFSNPGPSFLDDVAKVPLGGTFSPRVSINAGINNNNNSNNNSNIMGRKSWDAYDEERRRRNAAASLSMKEKEMQ